MSRRNHNHLNGVGLGLRWDFLEEILDAPAQPLAFLEVSPENYMRRGGYYPAALEELQQRYSFITHGLTLSLGSVETPDASYLEELAGEVSRLKSPWHSDHLCMTKADRWVLHDLFPMRRSQEAALRVADRMKLAEDKLGVPMVIENVSYYADFGANQLKEADFINEVLNASEGALLLDVNNVYVNAQNHGFDPRAFIEEMPLDKVVELHVAGHTRRADGLIIDTHGMPICDDVYELLEWTVARTGPVPVLLERDNNVPGLDELMREVSLVQASYDRGVKAYAA